MKNSISGMRRGRFRHRGGRQRRRGGGATLGLSSRARLDLLGQRCRDCHAARHGRPPEAGARTSGETRSARRTNTAPRASSLAIRGIDWFIRTSASSAVCEVLDIGRGALVEDHQIDGELLQPPIFVRAQKLADEFQIVFVIDADQNDGQIAGDPLRP